MPKLPPFITAILIGCIFPLIFSHPAWAQNVGFDRQIGEKHTAQDHLRLGVDFYLTDELDSAIQEFRQAQHHWPEYANAHWNLGVGLAKLGDLEGAVTAWAQAERVDPSTVPVRYNVSALVTYNYGIGLLKQGDLSQAITEWEQALQIQPDLAEIHYALGQAYHIKGNTLLSQRYLEQAVLWAPNWPEAIKQLGMAYYQNGEYGKALDYLTQAIRLKPADAQAHSNLGLVYLAKENLAKAEKAFTTALSLDPQLPQVHFNLGLLYVKKNDWLRAVDQLHTTILLTPQFADAHALLGSALSSTGNWPRAIQEWSIALALNPQAYYAHDLHFNMGMAHRITNANAKAIKAFRRAVQLQSYSAQAHFQLGVAYEIEKDWTQASDHYLFAIQHNPSWALPYFKLGLVRYNQGLLDAAIESFQRAIIFHPNYTDAHYQLGVTLRAANRPQESLTHIRLAAEQGMGEAQAMLGTMYANGSGTERDLVQAMRWWFQAAYGSTNEDRSELARAHLSRLRAWAFSHKENPDYIQQVLDGFNAIQTDIQTRFDKDDRLAAANSVGVILAQAGQRDEAIPILLQEALALNLEAHDYLENQLRHEEVGLYGSRILDYFSQTASEGSPRSCRFLKTFSAQRIPLTVRLSQHDSGVCPP